MKINNKEFKIYNADNEQSIKERIAVTLNTTVYWLWTSQILSSDSNPRSGSSETNDALRALSTDESIVAINILEDLRNSINNFTSFQDIEVKYTDWINSTEDSINSIAKMYIIFYSEEVQDSLGSFQVKILIEEFFRDYGGSEFDWNFIEDTLNNKEQILAILNQEIKDLKIRVSKKEDELKRIQEDIISNITVETTDFVIDSLVNKLSIETNEPIILTYILNSLNRDDILFAQYKKFFKIFPKNKMFFEKYDYDADNMSNSLNIVLLNTDSKKRVTFYDISITEIDESHFEIEIDVPNDEQITSILDSIFQDINYTIISSTSSKIKGTFYIKNTNFNKELFVDEIMNNDYFFNLYINERFKVGKNFNRLHIYMYSIKTEHVAFTMGQENTDIVIKINKLMSRNYIEYFMKFFVNLFVKYKSREQLLYNIYKKFIPTISDINLQKSDNPIKSTTNITKNPLALIEPTLFVPLYTRKCAQPPRILDDNESPPEGYQIMSYPKYNEGGLKERKYVCDREDNYIYPGLRKNTLPNNNVFRYIPCCYETNQILRKGSAWNAYYKGNRDKNEKYEYSLYKTARILPNNNKGILPSGITKLLGNVTRQGVFMGPNSFIDCISRIVNIDSCDINDERIRQNQLKDIRSKLRYEVCAQENYDIPNYQNWFNNPNLYFEPRRFFRALEDYFNINIYFFEKSTNHVCSYNDVTQCACVSDARNAESNLTFLKSNSPNGILGLPNRPKKGIFIDPKNYKKNAVIYVHMGSAIDRIDFPHCEIIETSDFPKIEKIYRNLLIFSRTDRLNISDISKIQCQFLDSSGRIIKILNKDGTSETFVNKPMLPLAVPIQTLTFEQTEDELEKYIYLKKLSRVFLEYCLIKYASSDFQSVQEFIYNQTSINTEKIYAKIIPEFRISYFDNIFLENGKIIFDSQDTQNRITYSMNKFEKKYGRNKFNTPVLKNYFISNSDFNSLILSEESFKKYAYDLPNGYAFNNFLQEIPLDVTMIMFKDNNYVELNGYFGVYTSLNELYKNIPINSIENTDKLFIWSDTGYKEFQTNGNGRIILIYKVNNKLYYLGKLSNIN